jgi:hypothetical protein
MGAAILVILSIIQQLLHNCGPSADYEYEVTEKVTPGLSYYVDSPVDSANIL